MAASGVIVRQRGALRHDPGQLIPGHPERPERLRRCEEELAAQRWLGQEVVFASEGREEDAALVHPRPYLERLAKAQAAGGAILDPDTALGPSSYATALEAASAACLLIDRLREGAERGFALLRPPGHHALAAEAMGFCLLNNAAVAAEHARRRHGLARVAIVDWDVHHGNGTEAIFLAEPAVLYISLHRYPFYPGTGSLADRGTGAGAGYTLNLPLPAGSDGALWRSALAELAVPALRRFAPQLIILSAGYDAHRDDPLGGCNLESDDYAELARAIGAVAQELGAPVGALLEGGYHPAALSASVIATIRGLTDGRRPRPLDRHPFVGLLEERLARLPAAAG